MIQALGDGSMVEMLDGSNRIYFDMSRKGARLKHQPWRGAQTARHAFAPEADA